MDYKPVIYLIVALIVSIVFIVASFIARSKKVEVLCIVLYYLDLLVAFWVFELKLPFMEIETVRLINHNIRTFMGIGFSALIMLALFEYIFKSNPTAHNKMGALISAIVFSVFFIFICIMISFLTYDRL